jgi:Uma2 family endonuclease
MIAQAQIARRYTPEEYLRQEIESDLRHEYINGDIVPMTGGTPDHNQILLNLAGTLNLRLVDQPYRVFAADQRLWIPHAKIYTYPDIMVVQGALSYQYDGPDTSLTLSNLEFTILLRDLYNKVVLEPDDEP